MSKGKRLLVVVGGAILGVLFLVLGIGEYRESRKLQKEGKQTLGAVTDADTHRGRKGRRSYYLTVQFKTEGQAAFEERKRVSRSLYREASEAGSVQVTYLPSDPTVCAFGPKVSTQLTGIVAGVIALGAAVFTGFSKSQDGDASPGSGTDVEKELLANNSKYDDQQKAA